MTNEQYRECQRAVAQLATELSRTAAALAKTVKAGKRATDLDDRAAVITAQAEMFELLSQSTNRAATAFTAGLGN